LFRALMIGTLPIVFPVIVLKALCHELLRALHMTWLEVKLEWASLVSMMRNPPIKTGGRDA